MKRVFWTIKFDNGYLWEVTLRRLRRDSIDRYLKSYATHKDADKSWAWHKRHNKVSVVQVHIVEF